MECCTSKYYVEWGKMCPNAIDRLPMKEANVSKGFCDVHFIFSLPLSDASYRCTTLLLEYTLLNLSFKKMLGLFLALCKCS